MPDESYPITNGEQLYSLRFEDRDVSQTEETLPLFVAFHPSNRTYAHAALFMWHGLRKKDEAGELVYTFPQDAQGKALALEWVKTFCQQFVGPMGMAILYGYLEKALVVAGYFGTSKEDTPEPEPEEANPPKNLPKRTGKGGKRRRSVSATSLPPSSGT